MLFINQTEMKESNFMLLEQAHDRVTKVSEALKDGCD
jgi:hypothetical protein